MKQTLNRIEWKSWLISACLVKAEYLEEIWFVGVINLSVSIAIKTKLG
jgi:hypothetical protein